MYCSNEKEIDLNILSFSFKMVCTWGFKQLRSLHICAFDFSCLSTAFIIATLVLIVIRFSR